MELSTRDRPVIIGVVGDSGTGKTTLAAGVARALGGERALVICADDYHKYSRKQRAIHGLTPHDPACNHLNILEQHIYLLQAGQPILKPVYNHNGGVLDPPEYVEPKDFIILEGLLGFGTAKLRDIFDVKFYLEPQEQLRLRWKFQRDTTVHGYTVEQVMALVEPLNRDAQRYIVPQRQYADMVISFSPPDDQPEETGERLNVRHILRPTLPDVDLAPVLEVGADKGFDLELARDIDGWPVDALHISGAVDDSRAEIMEDHLWSLIPGHEKRRPKLGEFRDGNRNIRHSHPLALSQLLITHYLLNAVVGHHAV